MQIHGLDNYTLPVNVQVVHCSCAAFITCCGSRFTRAVSVFICT